MALNDTRGSALMVALIGGVIMSLVAVQIFQSMSSSFRMQRQVAEQTDREDLRNAIRLGFDCKATMTPLDAACTYPSPGAPENLELKRSNAVVVLGRDVTDAKNIVGKYRMRARCPDIDGKRQVVVEAQNVKSTSTEWINLFPATNVPLGCFAP